MVLPMTESHSAVELGERVRAAVAAAIWHHPEFGALEITLSIGVAALPLPDVTDPQRLLACADQALYRAKNNGRNRVESFIVQERPSSLPAAPARGATRQ